MHERYGLVGTRNGIKLDFVDSTQCVACSYFKNRPGLLAATIWKDGHMVYDERGLNHNNQKALKAKRPEFELELRETLNRCWPGWLQE